MNTNWKSLGWLITGKLVYYVVVVLVGIFLLSIAASLLNVANSLIVVCGAVLACLTIGGLITLALREIFYYIEKLTK